MGEGGETGKGERQWQKETQVCGINRWVENGGLVVVDEFGGGAVDGERNEYERERNKKKERNEGWGVRNKNIDEGRKSRDGGGWEEAVKPSCARLDQDEYFWKLNRCVRE